MEIRRQAAITRVYGQTVLVYMENDTIYDVLTESGQEHSPAVGNIYIGKVQNIVKNINAAFVEIEKGILGYLSLTECGENPVKCGDELIVQIKRPAVKTKQAVVTRFPELTGRYCVIRTADSQKGISKKISSPEMRAELQKVLAKFQDVPYGIVLRTAAGKVSTETLREECQKLLEEMHNIMGKSRFLSCFSLVRGEIPFYLKYLYSCQPDELDRIITDDKEIYHTLLEDYEPKLSFYEDEDYPLDNLLGISSKLAKAMEKRVWLKSGGNIVIEPTEALTVIDVNTGKAIEGKREKEMTFFKINCEAAKEAARQIRVRNLSGMILIDFIDMKKREHVDELLNLLRQEFRKDKIKTVLVDMTKLGLVEITRKKQNPPLWEVLHKKA